jgi:hypothetical protein
MLRTGPKGPFSLPDRYGKAAATGGDDGHGQQSDFDLGGGMGASRRRRARQISASQIILRVGMDGWVVRLLSERLERTVQSIRQAAGREEMTALV